MALPSYTLTPEGDGLTVNLGMTNPVNPGQPLIFRVGFDELDEVKSVPADEFMQAWGEFYSTSQNLPIAVEEARQLKQLKSGQIPRPTVWNGFGSTGRNVLLRGKSAGIEYRFSFSNPDTTDLISAFDRQKGLPAGTGVTPAVTQTRMTVNRWGLILGGVFVAIVLFAGMARNAVPDIVILVALGIVMLAIFVVGFVQYRNRNRG